MGSTEKLSTFVSIFTPLLVLTLIDITMFNKINEK